jgi:hypothetical protein
MQELDPDEASMTFNSTTTWGWPAKALHWIGAVIILLLLVHGWWMTHMTPRPDRLAHYAGHSAPGYDLLALVILRLLWRWLNPVPELPADLKPGAHGRACRARRLYVLIAGRVAHRLGGRDDVPHPMTKDVFGIDAADRHGGGSIGAPVVRGIAHGPRLPAGRGRARPRHRGAASPSPQTQRRPAAHDLGHARLMSARGGR